MKLSLVTETFPPEINGVALTNYRLLRSMVQAGHDVELIRPRPAGHSRNGIWVPSRELGVPGWPIPFYRSMRFGHFCRARLVRRWRADRPDVVHIATEGPLGLAALLAAGRLSIPVTSTFHTNFHAYCRHYRAPLLQKPALRYLRWFHNRCERTLVPTPELQKELAAAGFVRLEHMGRGVDRQLFSPVKRKVKLRRVWGASDDAPVVLFVSRVAPEKNLPFVLETCREMRRAIPSLRVVVVGDGPSLAGTKRRFPEAHYAGMRFDEDLAEHYASADLFLFASTTETFGNVVLEAMASGLVVVTYNYAAGRLHIEHGRSGILVAYDQPRQFSQAARTLLQARSTWTTLGHQAREATARASWSEVARQFELALTETGSPGRSGARA